MQPGVRPVADRVNHRGWIVVDGIESGDHTLCVDFFEHPSGGFGFEHFRADPEDGGRWTAVGGFSRLRFPTLMAAARSAAQAIPWLASETGARESLQRLTASIRS